MKEQHVSDVSTVLARLDKTLHKNKNKNQKSYKEQNEERKKSFIKFHEGKNSIALLIPDGKKDPFFEWGYHTGLQEVSYYSVPCDKFNKGEKCIICDLVDNLKQDWEKNKHLWMPIQQKVEVYAPVVCLDSDKTIAEGPKWVKLSKTIMEVIFNWLNNLESDEFPPYYEEEPQKIIVTYDPEAQPKDKYKVDKKNMKAFSSSQLTEWKEMITPITDLMFSKTQEEVTKIVDEYLQRISDMLSEAEEEEKSKDEKESKSYKVTSNSKDSEKRIKHTEEDEDDVNAIFNTKRRSKLESLKIDEDDD